MWSCGFSGRSSGCSRKRHRAAATIPGVHTRGFEITGRAARSNHLRILRIIFPMAAAKDDPYHLYRFVEAQDPVYDQVCEELRRGYKTGHWMWFVFPQIAGLGSSE